MDEYGVNYPLNSDIKS